MYNSTEPNTGRENLDACRALTIFVHRLFVPVEMILFKISFTKVKQICN